MRELWRHVALGLRIHRRRPLLSLVIVLSLVLGIGVNTAVISLIDAIFLRPLPVEDLDRLVAVYQSSRTDAGDYTGMGRFSYPTYLDLKERSQTFEGMGLFTWTPVNFSADGVEPTRAVAMFGDAGYFESLGVVPAQGRFFRPEETDHRSVARVTVLSHAAWVSRFGADPDAVGRIVQINHLPFRVVGVGPPGFRGTQLHVDVDAWIPAATYRELGVLGETFFERDVSIFSIIGRLAPGVTPAQAQDELMALGQQLEAEYPVMEEGLGAVVEPLLAGVLLPRERPDYVGYTQVLSLAAALVLLVSCLNVAMLLLLRGLERVREIALRHVLGAGRGRLVRQLVGENLLLFAAGGLLAIPVAGWTLDLLWKFRPPRLSAGVLDSGLDDARLLCSLGLVAVTAVLFGVLPAWRTTRLDPAAQVKAGGNSEPPWAGRFRAGDLLVVGQVALAVIALVGGGLFVRHLAEAQSIELGFEPENLAVMTVAPGDQGYDDEQVRLFYRDLEERVRALPGVEAAAWSANRLLRGSVLQKNVFLPGGQEPLSGGGRLWHRTNAVRPGFFRTAGITLLQGRDFDERDRADGPAVAIINRTMAELAWPDEDALGKRFHFDYAHEPPVEVIGIAENAKYRYIHEDPQFFIYVPFSQAQPSSATLHVRTAGDPEDFLPALREQSRALDPHLPVADLATLESFVDQGLWLERAAATFLGAMGLLALVLVVIGIHGVMAFSVRRRAREFGIRLSLGAARSRVLRQILGEAGARVAAGLVLGVAGVVLVLRPAAASFLEGVDPLATATLAAAAAVLIGAAALAGTLRPARRSARGEPSLLLRDE